MSISFFHGGDLQMASYRYRCQMPAAALGATINDASADVWILAKPDRSMECIPELAKREGKILVTDVCDAHLTRNIYQHLIRQSDAVTACTPFMAQLIHEDVGREATVILDPYEAEESPPHVRGTNFLWFGHGSNFYSMYRYLPALKEETLHILTAGVQVMGETIDMIPWSLDEQWRQLAWADAVLIPETAPYKSANRAVEAIRSGCFVIAEPHPSLTEIPGIWIGNLLKGVAWFKTHQTEASSQLIESQAYVRETYSSARVANVWRTLLQGLRSNSDADKRDGKDGSTLMGVPGAEPMCSPTYGPYPWHLAQPMS